jgi:hypothetical protein
MSRENEMIKHAIKIANDAKNMNKRTRMVKGKYELTSGCEVYKYAPYTPDRTISNLNPDKKNSFKRGKIPHVAMFNTKATCFFDNKTSETNRDNIMSFRVAHLGGQEVTNLGPKSFDIIHKRSPPKLSGTHSYSSYEDLKNALKNAEKGFAIPATKKAEPAKKKVTRKKVKKKTSAKKQRDGKGTKKDPFRTKGLAEAHKKMRSRGKIWYRLRGKGRKLFLKV